MSKHMQIEKTNPSEAWYIEELCDVPCGDPYCTVDGCREDHPSGEYTVVGPFRVECCEPRTTKEFATLISAAPDMMEVLEEIEWGGSDYSREFDACPWCLEGKKRGHKEDCKFAAALRKARGKTP
jgi:hypothetical protein